MRALLLLLLFAAGAWLLPAEGQPVMAQTPPEKAALKFYSWYFREIRSGKGRHEAQVRKGERGYCRLDTARYLKTLRKLDFSGSAWIRNEYLRLSDCALFVSGLRWEDYVKAVPYQYTYGCRSLYFYQWLGSGDVPSGVEAVKTEYAEGGAYVFLRFYMTQEQSKVMLQGYYPVVWLKEEKGRWKIQSIEIRSE
jgi:hypothetical protein